MKRLNSIDIARAIAIFLMVMCHFIIYITRPEGSYPNIYFFGDHILGDFPAAMFLFLVGISLCVSINKSRQNGIPESSLFSRLIIRGAVIFIFGIIFITVVWGHKHTFDWDILTTIGSCIIILALLRNLSPKQLVLFAIVVLILSPYLRYLFGYPAFWDGDEYTAPWTIDAILGGFFLNGYFPLFPWIAYPLMGLAVGKAIFTEQDAAIRWKIQKKLPAIGAVVMIVGFGGFFINYYAGLSGVIALYVSELSFYPMSNTLFLIEGGFILLLFGLLNIRFDLKDIKHPVMKFLRRYSRYALSVYVIHHLLLIFIPRMIGKHFHQDDSFYYQDIFEAPTGLLLSVIFIFAFYPILILWDKVKGAGSFEWVVRKFVPKNQ
jgi:uncharacterized membrane protein